MQGAVGLISDIAKPMVTNHIFTFFWYHHEINCPFGQFNRVNVLFFELNMLLLLMIMTNKTQ
jgi:hypothetical protein